MKVLKWKKRFLAGILLALLIQAGFPGVSAEAAAGTVYTCTIHPSYRNPVTGEIEDSGGEASYATGQGMVEGAVYTTGILELTDTGEYYLTIRMSLMDYTSNHSFWVQNVGDSGWSTPALGVTGNGTDGNGTTSDICIQVPSENCVVRGAMYVEPMGRDVIFFLYPSDFAAGNSTDMNATMVTETSGSSSSSQTSDSAAAPSASSSSSLPFGNSQGSDSGETEESTGTQAEAEETKETQGAESEVQVLENTIEDPADTSQDTEEPSADETELNSAQGLSLSTAESSQEEEQTSAASSGTGAASQIMTLILAFTVSGLLLIGAAAGVVYYFRRNWRRWGGGEDDDE